MRPILPAILLCILMPALARTQTAPSVPASAQPAMAEGQKLEARKQTLRRSR